MPTTGWTGNGFGERSELRTRRSRGRSARSRSGICLNRDATPPSPRRSTTGAPSHARENCGRSGREEVRGIGSSAIISRRAAIDTGRPADVRTAAATGMEPFAADRTKELALEKSLEPQPFRRWPIGTRTRAARARGWKFVSAPATQHIHEACSGTERRIRSAGRSPRNQTGPGSFECPRVVHRRTASHRSVGRAEARCLVNWRSVTPIWNSTLPQAEPAADDSGTSRPNRRCRLHGL